MPDYPLMNQTLYEGRAPQLTELTEKALEEGAFLRALHGTAAHFLCTLWYCLHMICARTRKSRKTPLRQIVRTGRPVKK